MSEKAIGGRRVRGERLFPDRDERIVAMVQDGATYASAGREYSLSRAHVRQIVLRHNRLATAASELKDGKP